MRAENKILLKEAMKIYINVCRRVRENISNLIHQKIVAFSIKNQKLLLYFSFIYMCVYIE